MATDMIAPSGGVQGLASTRLRSKPSRAWGSQQPEICTRSLNSGTKGSTRLLACTKAKELRKGVQKKCSFLSRVAKHALVQRGHENWNIGKEIPPPCGGP